MSKFFELPENCAPENIKAKVVELKKRFLGSPAIEYLALVSEALIDAHLSDLKEANKKLHKRIDKKGLEQVASCDFITSFCAALEPIEMRDKQLKENCHANSKQ